MRRLATHLLIATLYVSGISGALAQTLPTPSDNPVAAVNALAPDKKIVLGPIDAPLSLYSHVIKNKLVRGKLKAISLDNKPLTFSLRREPQQGKAILRPNGTWQFESSKDFIGLTDFVITTSDGKASVNTRIVVVTNYKPSRKTYYVDAAKGQDSYNGSEAAPFATLKAAHDISRPGDTILIKNGLYKQSSKEAVVEISRSGLPGAKITYKAYPGHKPVLTSETAWNVILITASYIRVEGLEIKGVADTIDIKDSEALYEKFLDPKTRTWGPESSRINGNGIAVRPANNRAPIYERNIPHHIDIVGNHVHNLAGGGIYTDIADYILIEGNISHDNAWRSIFANSGISLFHSFDVDDNYKTYKNIIRNNIAYNNRSEVKWWAVKKMSDGNGIIVDDLVNGQLKATPYRGRTLVINNIAYNNGGAGLQSYASVNVDMFYNTAYKNSQTPELKYGELFVHSSHNSRIINNIAVTSEHSMINDGFRNEKVIYDNNIYFTDKTPRVLGPNDLQADPLFIDAEKGDFRLKKSSPAIDSATSVIENKIDYAGKKRPFGPKNDRGAMEYQGQ
jgi:hypothetical protein